LHDREFDLVNYTFCWGEPRVYFYDAGGRLRSLPASWISIGPVDPFIEGAAGRSPFRLDDFLRWSQLLQEVGNDL
jgi:hypothetical protein